MQRQPHVLLAVASAFFFVVAVDYALGREWGFGVAWAAGGALMTVAAVLSWRRARERARAFRAAEVPMSPTPRP
ncbi:MAG: hypothetical protein H6806_12475 [Planctomycetes bacterium]|nr:hypothetical protein [Planctomycetota bacterium]MCB9826338.1 hypothetical protein [Planctomycetota bacterium]MCB9830559.1 hypothetical protein [Planctomycetota bacterium]MCB9901134.1 hypothetical protein [Planctomycetota bacterium]